MKISVITASVRPEGLDMVGMCLRRQTFRDFQWIVVSPFEYKHADLWVPDPPKPEGYNYALNRSWNAGLEKASGELFISIVDLLWFPADVLENLWVHYQFDPTCCVSGIGNQYELPEKGKPESMVWKNPLYKEEQFYKIPPNDFELCVASVPMQGMIDIGGFDEEFDKYAAMSEKEMAFRLEKLGYSFWMDQTIEYRAIRHPRLTKDWDDRYFAGIPYFQKCIQDIQSGKRLKLDYLDKK